jgi:Protein of unknown function (DUF3108)
MLKIRKLAIILMLLQAQIAFALPKSVQTEYLLMRNGKKIAVVKESFSSDGKQYHVKSTTKGIGIYALWGERRLQSDGTVTKNGLKPNHFESTQGNNANKALIADFDWPKNTLNMQVKGELQTAVLEPGTQDLASYVYQFMFNPPKNNEVKVALTTGKKLNNYTYKVLARGEKLSLGKTNYKTLYISNADGAGDDKKQLWLIENLYYIPARYLLSDDGDTFEQTLTKIHVE